MNTFFYVLVGWIVVLYLVNKVREKISKPKTVKILVKRNGVYQEVDALVMSGNLSSDTDTDETDNEVSSSWMIKENDMTKSEYYSGRSFLKATRDIEAQKMDQNL